MNKNTRELLNFFHNTLDIKKEDIKAAVLQAAKEEGEREARRLIQTDKTLLDTIIKAGIENVFKYNSQQFSKAFLSEIIAAEVAKSIKVEVKQADTKTDGKGLTITFG